MNEWSFFCSNWLNARLQNSRWLPSSSWVRMNEFESDWNSLSQSFVQNGWIQDGRIKDGRIQDSHHHQVESEWMSEVFLCKMDECKMVELKMAEFKMVAIIKLSQNEWVKFFFVQNGWMQECRIQNCCHHQVESEWMSLSQIELVWVKVLCKMAESKMTELKMVEFKMAAIIKLHEKEWVGVRLNYFDSESEWSESVFEWIWQKITRCLNPRWQCLNSTWQNSRWLPSSSWVRMNEWSFFCANGGN